MKIDYGPDHLDKISKDVLDVWAKKQMEDWLFDAFGPKWFRDIAAKKSCMEKGCKEEGALIVMAGSPKNEFPVARSVVAAEKKDAWTYLKMWLKALHAMQEAIGMKEVELDVGLYCRTHGEARRISEKN